MMLGDLSHSTITGQSGGPSCHQSWATALFLVTWKASVPILRRPLCKRPEPTLTWRVEWHWLGVIVRYEMEVLYWRRVTLFK